MANKKIERRFLEDARRISLLIPAGEIRDSESPDFLIKTDSGILGIEVTQLFQPKATDQFSRRHAESFHQKVIHRASELYQKASSGPVDILVYFLEDRLKFDLDTMARSLTAFVQDNYRADQEIETHFYYDKCNNFPEGIFLIRIAPPLDGATNIWRTGESGKTLRLEYEFLAAEIQRKNVQVSRYRTKANYVWLLMVASLFPLSGSFSVPREVEKWNFSFDFDKVLLLSAEDTKVIELGCT